MSEPNPVGEPKVDLIAAEIDQIVGIWQENNPAPGWFTKVKGAWFKAVGFLMNVTDYLILFVDDLIPEGADKKATVMTAVGLIYDKIVPPLLPMFIKPFNSQIKAFVLNVLVSMTIDFIVTKYREGTWRPKRTLASLV